MSSNGTAPLIPASGTQDEQGSAIDRDRLFLYFEDGRTFTPYDVGPRHIDTMLKSDGKGRSIEQALTLPPRSATWDITPSDGDKGEAEFVKDALTRNSNAGGMSVPFEMVLAQAISACLYRRAFFEKVFKLDPDSGRIVYDKIAFRPAGTCRLLFDESTGSFNGFRQRVPMDHPKADDEGMVTIKPQRSFVFVYGQHRRPIEGVSDLETAYGIFETKQKIKFLWAAFLENQVMPKAIASDESSNEAANAFARKVATLKGGGVVGIGPGQDVKPYETSIAAAQAFSDAIRFLDSEMYASVLAGFLELASAASLGRGSYALSESQSDFFLQSRQALLTELAAAVENYLIADLVRWNFGPNAAVPQFKFGSLRTGDVQNSVVLLQALAVSPQPLDAAMREFTDELIVKTAGYLDLDVDRVAKAIKDRQAQAPPTQLGQTQAGVDAAKALLQSAGVPRPAVSLSEPAYGLDLSEEMRDLTEALKERPKREKTPKVDVHSPVNVTTPDVHVTTPPVNVSVPQAKAPDVHVDVHPPDIHVTVERGGGFTIEHDSEGRVTGTSPKED